MSNSGATAQAAIQCRIDRYLKAVDEVLKRSGSSWRDRNSILDNIQTQIREMLAQRAADGPTVADAEAVIAALDAPESYAPEPAAEAQPARANPLRPLYLLLSWIFYFFFIIDVVGVLVPIGAQWLAPDSGAVVGIIPLLYSILVAVILFRVAIMFSKAARGR